MTAPPIAALRVAIVLVAVALALALVGIVWSHHAARDAEAGLTEQHAAHAAAQQRLARSREEQRLIEAHQEAYLRFVEAGFIGAEDRLAWIEAVQLASRSVGLAGLEYRLSPRSPAPPGLAQALPLGQTTMTLTMPILVETDLPRFFAALRTRAPGIYRIQGCRLSRVGNEAFKAADQPRLKVECELVWYTLASASQASAS